MYMCVHDYNFFHILFLDGLSKDIAQSDFLNSILINLEFW